MLVYVAGSSSVRGELGDLVALGVRPEVEAQLRALASGQQTLVLATGDTPRRTMAAVLAAGLTPVEVFQHFAIVAAAGSADAVRALHRQPGIHRVDASPQLKYLDDLAHRSTGIDQLRDAAAFPELADLRRPDGSPYDGSGVSIAVIDTGFDPTHEQFVDAGETKFDVHLRQACAIPGEIIEYVASVNPSPYCSLWVPATVVRDPDPYGHGTPVAATAAGYPRTSPGGVHVSGAAPGARLVGLSVGATDVIYNAFSALNWVLEHRRDPCGDGSCAPIRVVNNSYGLGADLLFRHRFDPESPMSRVTTALVEEGVVVVFAAGNDGGDGTAALTNFLALNPVPGFLTVGAYHDANAGDSDMLAAEFSSRGKKGEPATYPDMLAPGANLASGCAPRTFLCIASYGPGGDQPYGMYDGTSLSAPYVAGVVAQLFEADPTLTPADIEDILEDTAHQLGRPEDLEPDVYLDPAGNIRGNDDHLTSFDAGHGNVDVVRALAEVLQRSPRNAPDMCPRLTSVEVADPEDDTRVATQPAGPLDLAAYDIVDVAAGLDAVPGALSIVVTFSDLPAVAVTPMHTSVIVSADGGGDLGSDMAEILFDRSPAGDSFRVFYGDVSVDGAVDAEADTVTFLVRPLGGALQVRGTLMWVWSATIGESQALTIDDVQGRCTMWLQP